MQEPGIQPPSATLVRLLQQRLGPELARFVSVLASSYPRVRSYTPSLDPGSVAANSEDEQSFTVAGLTPNDVVLVNKPTRTAGLNIVQARAATDTLHLTYLNTTGSPIDAPSETYRIVAIRL